MAGQSMTIEIGVLDENKSFDDWDYILNKSINSTVFHKIEWLKIIERHSESKLYPFVISHGDKTVGIYPLFIQKKAIFNLALSPPPNALMLYLGPVLRTEYKNQNKTEQMYIEVQNKINENIKKLNVDYIRIRTSPGLYDIRPFKWSGYNSEPLYTYFLDLSKDIEKIWENLNKQLRQNVRSAEKKGVEIKEGDKENIEDYYNLMKNNFELQGIKARDYRNLLYDLYEELSPENLRIFKAEYENKIIGIQLVTAFENRISLWTGSPKTNILRGTPNELMQWEIIKWAHEKDYRYLEIMDAGDDPRFRYFKAKYNPEPQIWFSNIKYSSRLVNILKFFTKKGQY